MRYAMAVVVLLLIRLLLRSEEMGSPFCSEFLILRGIAELGNVLAKFVSIFGRMSTKGRILYSMNTGLILCVIPVTLGGSLLKDLPYSSQSISFYLSHSYELQFLHLY